MIAVAKNIVVRGDRVEGTDTHNVSGSGVQAGSPPTTVSYTGTARYDYKGKMTDQLSDLVSIDGSPAATVASRSSLNPGETAPGGGHHGATASIATFTPTSPTPTTSTMSITDTVGEGRPSATAGSKLVKIDGVPVLLDGDSIDSCDGMQVPMNSSVTAETQSFVSCSD